MDIMVGTFSCDITRVASLIMAPSRSELVLIVVRRRAGVSPRERVRPRIDPARARLFDQRKEMP